MAITIDTTEVTDYLDDLLDSLDRNDLALICAEHGLPIAQELLPEFNPHIEQVSEDTVSIVAEGEGVAFAEFGTGVYAEYNLPTNITVAPGSWSQSPHGQGQFIPGEHEYWFHAGQRYTGTQPRNGIYNAAMAIDDDLDEIVGEFLDD